MRNWLALVLFLLSSQVFAQIFVEGGIGYIRYRDPFMESIAKTPTGLNIAITGGYRYDFFAAEAFYGKANHQVIIKHNQVSYFYHMDDSYLGFGGRAYLDIFYIRMGYAFHTLTPQLKDHPANTETIENEASVYYKADSKSISSSGIYLGFGVEYALSDLFGVYGQSSLYALSAQGTNTFTFDVGIRMTFGSSGGSGAGAAGAGAGAGGN